MVNKNFWDLLREKQGTLTKSGTIIADYLTRHAEEAQFLSISSLAKECNMAEATIYRFCKQLGFEDDLSSEQLDTCFVLLKHKVVVICFFILCNCSAVFVHKLTCYISLRHSRARERVTSSAYSSSAPTGIP